MSFWGRVAHWSLSPVGLVLASLAVIYGLDEWSSAETRAAYEKEAAERRAKAPAAETLPPLFKAIRDKSGEGVRAAIAQGADVNARAKNGSTALHMAAGSSSKELVELLLERGADVNAKAKDGKTPLMRAERLEIAELLLARGAQWESGESGIDPDGSRIREAARKGDEKLIELLLAKGAEANRAPKGWPAPIAHAVKGGHLAAVRTLLSAGAKPDATGFGNSSLLHVAAESNHPEVAKALIAAGADVNAKRPSGWTPLHVASSLCHEDLAALLVASGADPQARDRHGKTPLPCYAFARRPARGAPMQVASCR